MTGRTWSPSAIILARSCRLAWWLRYADPDRPKARGEAAPAETPRVLGVIAHTGLSAAYGALCDDPEHFVAGATMARYLDLALDAIADAWTVAGLPRHSAGRVRVLTEVETALKSLPRPHPLAVLSVERKLSMTGPSGTPFTTIPDLVLRTGADSAHVRDWKRTAVSSLGRPADLLEDDQLAPYVVAVAQRWPWVRRVSVGLFSVTSNREVVLEDFPVDTALERVRGQEVTAYEVEHALDSGGGFPATPDGSNCTRCDGRARCPVWNPPDTQKDFLLTH